MNQNTYSRPPRIAQWLLARLFPDNDQHTTLGDLEEAYHGLSEERNFFWARSWYWAQLFKALPPFVISFLYSAPGLCKSYFLIAYRTMRKEKLHSFIHVFGLSIGMACCILAYTFIKHEYSYDLFHKNIDNIHVVGLELKYEYGKAVTDVFFAPPPVAVYMKQNFQEVEYAVRATYWGETTLRVNKNILRKTVLSSEKHFFDIFSFPFIFGSKKNALAKERSVVISEDLWRTHFDGVNPVGRSLFVKIKDELIEFKIAAVLKAIPEASSLKFDELVPFENSKLNHGQNYLDNWNTHYTGVIVKLHEGGQIENILNNFPNIIAKFGLERERGVAGGLYFTGTLKSFPFKDLHLYRPGNLNSETVSAPIYSYTIGILALLIFAVVCISIIYLNAGMSIKRADEFFMRKTFGSRRFQLIKQLLGETLLPTWAALAVSIFLVILFLPVVYRFSEVSLSYSYLSSFQSALVVFILILVVSVVSSIYSTLRSTKNRSETKSTNNSELFKKIILGAKFVNYSILIAVALIMGAQVNFFKSIDLGYDPDNLVYVKLPFYINPIQLQEFKDEVSKANGVVNLSSYSHFSVTIDNSGKKYNVNSLVVEPTFFDVMKIKLLKRMDTSGKTTHYTGKTVFVNESFVNYFGLSNPIGMTFNFSYYNKVPIIEERKIAGVVKNYHSRTIWREIKPTVFLTHFERPFSLYIKLDGSDTDGTITQIKETWENILPNEFFEWQFVLEHIESGYKSEARWTTIMMLAAILSAFLTIFGLIGIIALTMVSMRKEISIRKSMGASTRTILKMINGEFIGLILLSNVIAWPVAYLVMEKWLDQFYYKIDLTIWYFVGSSLIGLVIAVLTISAQAYKAASANPVDALRRE